MSGSQLSRRLGHVVWVPVCLLTLAAGCSLILDFSEPTEQEPEIDAAPLPDAFDKMLCMVFEGGNSVEMPEVVDTFPAEPIVAAVCNGGTPEDFYAFESAGAQTITIQLEYSGGMGALGIKFHDPALTDTELGDSQGQGGEATLTIDGGMVGTATYVIEVYAVGSAENAYTLTATQ